MPKLSAPAIQWYYRQWLGDQKVLAMDWDANGMHFWLINLSLQEDPAGTIPNDTALIRRWLRNPSDDVWRRVQPQIFSAWSLADGRWHQQGTKATAERQKAYSESRTEAANARWAKRDAYALRMQCEIDALQSSTSSSIQEQIPPRKKRALEPFVLPDWIPPSVWNAYLEMRQRKGKPPTAFALELVTKKLYGFMQNGHDPAAVLEQSIRSGWTDVYPVREGGNYAASGINRAQARTDSNIANAQAAYAEMFEPHGDAGRGTSGES